MAALRQLKTSAIRLLDWLNESSPGRWNVTALASSDMDRLYSGGYR